MASFFLVARQWRYLDEEMVKDFDDSNNDSKTIWWNGGYVVKKYLKLSYKNASKDSIITAYSDIETKKKKNQIWRIKAFIVDDDGGGGGGCQDIRKCDEIEI